MRMKTISHAPNITAVSSKTITCFLLSSILLLGLVGCGGSGGSSNLATSTASINDTAPELAKDILSRYGYAVEEYWKIVDRARSDGNMYFMPINSNIRNLVENCIPVVTTTETLERIELVDRTSGLVFPDYCKVEFLYEKSVSGVGDNQTHTLRMVMKLKDSSFNPFHHFQSLECNGTGIGSKTQNSFDVTASSRCVVVNNYTGEFQSSYSTHITGINDKIKTVIDAVISTPGQPEKGMRPGTAQVRYDSDTFTNVFALTFNGEVSTAIESASWFPGLRVN